MLFRVVLIDLFCFYEIDQMGFIAFYQSIWSVVDVKWSPCWLGPRCKLAKPGKICLFFKIDVWRVLAFRPLDFCNIFNNDLKSLLQTLRINHKYEFLLVFPYFYTASYKVIYLSYKTITLGHMCFRIIRSSIYGQLTVYFGITSM